MYIQVLSVSQPVPAATWQLFAFVSATLPLHRRMQIENLNKTLWPGVQNKLKERRWTEEFVLAVGLAKTPQWSSLAVWWQGKLWLWQTEKVLLLLLYNFSTKSTTQRKKKNKTHPSGHCGRWFNFTNPLKNTVQMVLKEKRTKAQHVKIHHLRLPSCNSLC